MIGITRQSQVALLIGLAAGIAIAVAVTTIVSAQSATLSTDVRITARLLENGKVEFGLQQREGDAWGEIILPRVNKFPYATATVDRWLYSSRVAVTTTAPPAVAAGTWRRNVRQVPAGHVVEWLLAGTGEYAAGGRARYASDAAPQLDLSCLIESDGDSVPLVSFTAERLAFGLNVHMDMPNLRAHVADGAANWVRVIAFDQAAPRFSPLSAHAFMDWLVVNYARSPILTLDAYDEGQLYFSGTFDITGLPAVLADLPCYE